MDSLNYLLHKVKNQIIQWNRFETGTRRVPEAIQQQANTDDIFAPPPSVPSEEERNNQIREEKLSALLTSEISSDTANWLGKLLI